VYRPLLSVSLQPEVLFYDRWMQLNEEAHGGFRSWAKRMFSGMELDTSDKIDKKIRFILDTSPTWDRFWMLPYSSFFLHPNHL
jgi:hypothetical protein